jgi:RHS repeat-associated protein
MNQAIWRNVKRHDYLPFGEELGNGISGRSTTQGYGAGDDVRQQFTQKERDVETGLDYFGARYYSSTHGRFTNPDDFWKDSQVIDPQSWNKYVYVRNNPLKLVDPEGEKATVTIKTNEDAKTGTVKIEATIAIYAMPGSNVTPEQMGQAYVDITNSIEKAWSGTYKQNGISFTVETDVSVTIVSDEQTGRDLGYQNVIGVWNGPIAHNADSVVMPGPIFGGPDTGQWNINNLADGVAAHEFAHLLGVDDRTSGSYLSNTNLLSDSSIPRSATAYDYGWALGGAINKHRAESKQYIKSPNSWETRSSGGAPRLGPPMSHTSTHELKAGRIFWN